MLTSITLGAVLVGAIALVGSPKTNWSQVKGQTTLIELQVQSNFLRTGGVVANNCV